MKQATNERDTLYRPREAAQRMGIGLSTFWLWAKTEPTFPKLIKIGKRCTVISANDLDAFIASKRGA